MCDGNYRFSILRRKDIPTVELSRETTTPLETRGKEAIEVTDRRSKNSRTHRYFTVAMQCYYHSGRSVVFREIPVVPEDRSRLKTSPAEY